MNGAESSFSSVRQPAVNDGSKTTNAEKPHWEAPNDGGVAVPPEGPPLGQHQLFNRDVIVQDSRPVNFFGSKPERFSDEILAVFKPVGCVVMAAGQVDDL